MILRWTCDEVEMNFKSGSARRISRPRGKFRGCAAKFQAARPNSRLRGHERPKFEAARGLRSQFRWVQQLRGCVQRNKCPPSCPFAVQEKARDQAREGHAKGGQGRGMLGVAMQSRVRQGAPRRSTYTHTHTQTLTDAAQWICREIRKLTDT